MGTLPSSRLVYVLVPPLAVAAGALLRTGLLALVGDLPTFITFYPAVVLVAMFLGGRAGVAATLLSAVVADLFFMPPVWPVLHSANHATALALFTTAGLLISLMAERLELSRRVAVEAAERERSRQAMEESAAETERQRELLSVTLSSIGDAVIVTDVRGRVTFMNNEAQRLTGWAGADAAGQPLAEVFKIINEHTRQPVESPVDKVLRLGMVVGLANHTVLIARDGRQTPIDDSGAPIRQKDGSVVGVVLVFRDFSERKAAEHALRRSEAQLQTIVEHLAEGLVVSDLEGNLLHWNRAALRMLEYKSLDEVRRRLSEFASIYEFTELDGAPVPLERWPMSRILAGQTLGDCELRLRRLRDGQERILSYNGSQVRDPSGKVLAVLTFTDVTERKAAEAALAAARVSADHARQQAEHASKAKDHFLAVLSHELRTPLTPVTTALSMLQRRPELDARMREDLEMIRRNVELEARLIDDLLDVTRIERGKVDLQKREVPLGEVIQRAIEVCRGDLEARQLELAVDLGGEGPCPIHADAARLQQVFWNLLRNAVKFTLPGGRVEVRARRGTFDGVPARPAGHAADPCVIVEIADTGMGIEPDVLPRLFNAFEQAERSITRQFGGLGLGLTISRAMVEMHGGTIDARSDGRNQGATFTVRLPIMPRTPEARACAAAASAAARPSGEPAAAARRLRILLVEDHGDTARIMRQLLAMDGHEVKVAGDVATGLAAADANLDLLISDLGLPDASGLELLRELRRRGYTFPAIALSGYGQEEDIHRSRQAGFAAHLTKPADVDKLAETIAAVAGPGRA